MIYLFYYLFKNLNKINGQKLIVLIKEMYLFVDG